MDDDEKIRVGDVMLSMDKVLTLHINNPMKRALRATAARRHVSISDVVRQAIDGYARANYPEYIEYYNRFVIEEVEAMMPENTDYDDLRDFVNIMQGDIR